MEKAERTDYGQEASLTEEIKRSLDQRTKEVEAVVERYLPEETGHQKTIFEAMNYSVRAGGKSI